MPNYDLGLAHGKIKIDADTRGATETEAELAALGKEVDRLNKKLEELEGGFDDYEDSTHRSGKASKLLDRDLRQLVPTILKIRNALGVAVPAMRSLYTTTDGFKNNIGLRNILAATPKMMLLRAAVGKAQDKFLGLNKALEALSPRTQNIRRLAQNVALFAGGYAVFRRYGGALTNVAQKFGIVRKAMELGNRGLKELIGTAAGGQTILAKAARGILQVGLGAKDAGSFIDGVIPQFGKLGAGITGVITGGALLKKGLGDLKDSFAWITKIPPQFLAIGGAIAVGLKPLGELGGKILVATSNLALQLFDATKQLAGGFLALPGAIGTAVTAMGTAKLLASGLTKAFEGVLGAGTGVFDTTQTLDDFNAALEVLPKSIQPVAKQLFALKTDFEKLQLASVETFGIGLEDSLKRVGELMNGPVKNGTQGVIIQFGQARDRLLDFLTQRSSVQDLGKLFGYTGQTVQALSTAFIPLAAGLKDITVVGARFIRDLSQGAVGLTQRFAEFAAKNRANGNLFKWMEEGKQGALDLLHGTIDLGKALGGLLTLFASETGDNALQRYADAMEKFNAAVNASKAQGVLHDIGQAVRNFGTHDLTSIKDFFTGDGIKSFGGLKEVGVDLFKALGEATKSFVSRLTDILKYSAPILSFISSMTEFFSPVVGKILAMTVAFKGFLLIIKPLKAALVSVFAVGTITKFAGVLNTALVGLASVGPLGAKAAGGIAKVANAALAMGSAFTAAAAAFTVIYLAISEGQDEIADSQKSIDEATQNSIDNVEQLKEAFTADQGTAGKNVFTQVQDDLQEMQDDLKNVADNAPGLLGDIVDQLGNIQDAPKTPSGLEEGVRDEFGNLTFGGDKNNHSDQFEQIEKVTKEAELASKAFDRLKISNQQLQAIVTGSQAGFDAQVSAIRASGEGGNEAAAKLEAYRKQYLELQDTFAAAGPGASQIAAGIKEIADAGGDASAKLDGVKKALQGLGLLQTTAIEDAFNYAEAVRDIGDKAADAALGLDPLDKLLNDQGGFNTASQGAKKLYDVLQPVAEAFLRTAVSSGDAQGAYQALVPQIQGVADQFKLGKEQIDGLLSSLGVDPKTVEILMQLNGKDDVTQGLASTLLQAQAQAKSGGIKLPILLENPADVAQKLKDAFGAGAITSQNAAGITINPDIVTDPAKLAKFYQLLANAGVQMPGGPPVPPAAQAEVPAAPATQPNRVNRPDSDVGANTAPLTPDQAPVVQAASAPAPDTTALDEVSAKYAELQKQFAELQANPPKIDIDPGSINETAGQLEAAGQKFVAFKEAVATSMQQAQDIVTAVAANLLTPIAGVAAQAYTYGAAIGQGLANGLAAKLGDVQKAAADLAGAVAANTKPGSPTKEGPLSGQGWVGYSGAKTAKAYADALRSGSPLVRDAAGRLAGAVATNLNTYKGGNNSGQQPGDKAGEFLGELSKLVDFGSHFVDAISKISDSVFGFAKLISDPLGKGTFFGKSPASAFGFRRDPDVTDKQLADKQDERLQDKLQGTKEKALNPEEKAADEQKKADAKKQAELNAAAIDRVVGGERVAPLSEEEQQAAKDAKKASGKTDTEKKLTDLEKATKTQAEFDKDTRQAAADASAKLDALSPEDLAKVTSGEISLKTQDEMLAELQKQTPLLGEAIEVSKKDKPGEEESIKSLNTIQQLIDEQGEAKTPAAKQQLDALTGLQSTIKTNAGITEGANPIDQAQAAAGAATSIASDVFKSIQGFIEAVGATKNIADTLVRGVANTEDIYRMVDDVQKYIAYAANIASTVGSVLSTVGSFTAGSDFGATSAAGSAASLVSGALEAVNAGIDLAQEAYRIAGSYVGQALGILTGGSGSALQGDVKFLLDTQTNQLLTYGTNNPQDKRVHDGVGGAINPDSRNQQIGSINVYGGPGSDPRDNTRQMMYQVRAANFAGVGATSG